MKLKQFAPSTCGGFVIEIEDGAYTVWTAEEARGLAEVHLDCATRILRMHNTSLDPERRAHEAIAAQIEAALAVSRRAAA